ncbi:hypothetical protein CO2235_MP10174 [Cupriavidus oxalaticus]|uniref:Uncharacterized protein n=1 Tax=Cupriavidus oxalaticus TaxID=96344 RepID=A0A976BG04_9BURK|nr:hypothetical protein CO2235_MP10174 [Cupriavidus oxalaticus]
MPGFLYGAWLRCRAGLPDAVVRHGGLGLTRLLNAPRAGRGPCCWRQRKDACGCAARRQHLRSGALARNASLRSLGAIAGAESFIFRLFAPLSRAREREHTIGHRGAPGRQAVPPCNEAQPRTKALPTTIRVAARRARQRAFGYFCRSGKSDSPL